MPVQRRQAIRTRGAVPPTVLGFVILALVIALIWCLFPTGRGKPKIVAKAYTVLPSGCPDSAAPSDTTQLGACLQGLDFDTVPAIGDEQRLMVRARLPGPFCHGDTGPTVPLRSPCQDRAGDRSRSTPTARCSKAG